ncbi:MAG: AAA family ATPase [Bryobacterales bacterium]|nr:AAA family ATPase [Bryobacterales bacterium]MDE0436662.1 AAA family ATPase [Bryobacterales bacterium]
MKWSIPQPSGDPLAVELEAGEQIFVVGPNGSGKSALLQHLAASSGEGKIRRIFAHRQTWLQSGGLTHTPESRRRFERDRSGYETANDAIWRDRTGAETHAAVLFDLVAAENKRARSIAGYVENSKIECAEKTANAASPFTRLNDLLRAGTLRVSLHNPDDVEIVASKGFGPTFGIERMSDGERNAVIMAATVLTVDPDTTLLIDEPERHLHRAIIAPFLSALFEQRQDCAFVVSTHELFLPVENPSARVLMTRSCTWAEANPQAWDLEILAHPAELPEELRLAVLGARSRVLFVEGSSTSLDLPLYDTLFPELSVLPRGNCVDVERAVRGLRATRDRHHVEAYGIVDRDDLDDAAVDKLAEAGIFALAVRSVESLYYCSDAMQAVARHQADSMGLDAANLAGSAKRDALAALAAEEVIQRMAARRCERRMRDNVLSQLPDWKTIRSAMSPTIDLHVPSGFADEVAQFRRLLTGEDFDALVARYPLRETRAFGAITTALKCASIRDYEQMVVVRAAKDEALATALKNRLHPLAEAITSATARS